MELRQANPRDLERLEAKLDRVDRKLDELLERQRWQKDLVDEFAPIAREMVKVGADNLHTLDQAGYFTFGREALRVMQRIVESYSEDDVRQLGDHIVGIMDTIKNVTQPAILSVANDATALLSQSDDLEPMGVVDMVKASRDDDVQKGTAIMFEILRQVGRTASGSAAEAAPEPRTKPRAPAATKNNGVATPNGKAASVEREGNGKDGWELTEQGHLLHPEQWSETFAAAMAGSLGLGALDPEQWKVVRAARQEYREAGAAPNIRRLGTCAGVPTKALNQLFPKAPARTVAKIAGIPKPAGCI